MCILIWTIVSFVYFFFHICAAMQNETAPAPCLCTGISCNKDQSLLLPLHIVLVLYLTLEVFYKQPVVDGSAGSLQQLCSLHELCAVH